MHDFGVSDQLLVKSKGKFEFEGVRVVYTVSNFI